MDRAIVFMSLDKKIPSNKIAELSDELEKLPENKVLEILAFSNLID